MPTIWIKDLTPTFEKVSLGFAFVSDNHFIPNPLLIDLNIVENFPDFREALLHFSSTVGMFCAIISLLGYHICTDLDK